MLNKLFNIFIILAIVSCASQPIDYVEVSEEQKIERELISLEKGYLEDIRGSNF